MPLGIQLTGGKKLRAEGLTGKGIRVAVIDSGVDDQHPGFDGKVVQQRWFRWGTPLSDDDHGTHVAGTIHMMAPDAELLDYRVFGEEGGFSVDEAIAVSIVEAVYDGCQVINMSLGGRWPSLNIRTAVEYAESEGVIVVCAAGNEGDDDPLTNERGYPALWDNTICVAAVKKDGGFPVAKFSSSNPQVDYSGIGVDVTSFKPGGGFQQMSGTSMACPHVAGLIAALLSDGRLKFEPGEKKDDFVREHLEKYHCVDIDKVGPDYATGIGFLTYLDKDEYEALIRTTWANEVEI